MTLRERPAAVFEPWQPELIPHSYDIVGDIALIRVPEVVENRTKEIAEAIMQSNKRVRVVFRQVSPVSGNLRLRGLSSVAGEKRAETVHREYGCLFKVDLERCYFSPRLLYERRRIA